MCCVIGPSGSGKSTLLRCINLLEPPDDGRILLDRSGGEARAKAESLLDRVELSDEVNEDPSACREANSSGWQ